MTICPLRLASTSADSSGWQRVVSQFKFHASYLGVLLFSFGYLQFGKLGRAISLLPAR